MGGGAVGAKSKLKINANPILIHTVPGGQTEALRSHPVRPSRSLGKSLMPRVGRPLSETGMLCQQEPFPSGLPNPRRGELSHAFHSHMERCSKTSPLSKKK